MPWLHIFVPVVFSASCYEGTPSNGSSQYWGEGGSAMVALFPSGVEQNLIHAPAFTFLPMCTRTHGAIAAPYVWLHLQWPKSWSMQCFCCHKGAGANCSVSCIWVIYGKANTFGSGVYSFFA